MNRLAASRLPRSAPSRALRLARLALPLFLTAVPALRAQGFDDRLSGFDKIGTFRGAPIDDFGNAFENEIFREARSGDLFQELGDIELGFGGSWERAAFDTTLAFSRRVLMRHRELPDGAALPNDALSGFRTLNQATAKTDFPISFLTDNAKPFSLGLRATSGFVLSVAETQPVRTLPPQLEMPKKGGNLRDELSGYWHSKDARFRRNIFPRIGRSMVALIDSLSGLLERNFEDTERGAVYFEGVAEPMMMQADLGFPLRPGLFTNEDKRLAPGDGATYTTFVGFSPIQASVKIPAARAGLEYFIRLFRETTVIELPDQKVLVRARTLVSRGEDFTPLKIRPEIRLLLLRYGYTFFDDHHVHSAFRNAELVYRFDLANPTGREAFAAFLGADQRIRFRPALDAAAHHDGVEILLASTRDGKRNDASRLARFPSWFRWKTQDLSVDQHLGIGGLQLLQASRGSSRSFRSSPPFTRKGRRDRSESSVVEIQAKPKEGEVEGQRSFEVRSTYRNRQEDPETAIRFARLLAALPDAKIDPAVIRQLSSGTVPIVLTPPPPPPNSSQPGAAPPANGGAPAASTASTAQFPEPQLSPPTLAVATSPVKARGLTSALRVGITGDAFERFLHLTQSVLWKIAATTLLGPEHADDWQTPEQRETYRKARDRKVRRSFGEAKDFLERCAQMRDKLTAERVTRPDWFRGSARASDVTLLQMAMLAASADAGETPYYRVEVWSDGRPRPWIWSSGRSPLNRPAGWTLSSETTSAPLPGVSDLSGLLPGESAGAIGVADNLRSSAPRLLAGVLYRSDSSATHYRLILFSDLIFHPDQSLRIEVRRSRIRADIPLRLTTTAMTAPQPVPQGPFAVSLFRYDVDLPDAAIAGLPAGAGYSLSLRVTNPQSQPLTEQQLLRFRL